jgi:hypothetical protein
MHNLHKQMQAQRDSALLFNKLQPQLYVPGLLVGSLERGCAGLWLRILACCNHSSVFVTEGCPTESLVECRSPPIRETLFTCCRNRASANNERKDAK